MKFYTSVLPYRGRLLVRGVDKDGSQKKYRINYKPSLFIPTAKESEYKTLDGRNVAKIKFNSIPETTKWINEYKDVTNFEYFGNTRHQYPFIADEFPGKIDWDLKEIKLLTIDIECESENGFPNPDKADEPLICITVKDHTSKKIIVFGMGNFVNDREDVQYINCVTETGLAETFTRFWVEYNPDIITGWNVKFFDIPYLFNRFKYLLGDDWILQYSPWRVVEQRSTRITGKGYKKQENYWDILGVDVLDYLDLYRKHTFIRRESYKLDYIGEVELGENKNENPYDTFKEFYSNDYQKFVEYNIQDVELVDKLEDKMQLIALHLTMAYEAKVNYQDVFGQVRIWDCIIYNHLRSKNIVPPAITESKESFGYEGAYVKDPVVGFHEWIVSFDLNSLYPHLIMQYNISPETMVGFEPNRVNVENMLNQEFDLSDLDNRTITPNGAQFRTDKRGFLPELMDKLYQERVIYKKKMLEAKTKYQQTGDKKYWLQIAKNHNIQYARKIALNSAYGAIGNQYFRYFDVRHAEGITMAGQLTMRWIERDVNKFLNKLLKTTNVSYVVASDTDSIYIRLGEVVNRIFKDKSNTRKIVKVLDRFCEETLQPQIDKSFDKLAKYVHAYDQKMIMKREVIANKGIWTAKKRYILNVYNEEGVELKEPKFKIMGIEAVKSSTPAACRDKIKEALKVIMTKDELALIQFIDDFRHKFKKLSPEEIAYPRSCNNLKKYSSRTTIYKKSCPIHVRGALLYNNLLKKKKLKKYEQIQEGDKVKFIQLKEPNPLRENVISFIGALPKEFDLHQYIDYDNQFDKSFLEPLRFIVNAIGWSFERQSTLDEFF
ncbi:DNA polymerase [Marine Group I thaumarchaeote]|uniref:DNA polymerase n=1 Tax=Marine Group I thaumarchaeote TaxID=2511932 RepID=A0A7K4MSI0_9ARCH|nr:DNA polymerase [Marine Group I thaumarchaeote]